MPITVRQPEPWEVIADRDHPSTQGMIGWWIFNERGGLTLHDYSGFGHNAAFASFPPATGWVLNTNEKVVGYAARFDGSDSATSSFPDTGFPLCIVATFYRNTGSGTRTLVDISDGSTTNQYAIAIRASSDAIRIITNNTTNQTNQNSANQTWDSIVCVWESATLRYVYINGVKSNEHTASIVPTGVNEIKISSAWIGDIGEVRVYNRLITQRDAQELSDTPFIGLLQRRDVFFVPAVVGGVTIPVFINSYRQHHQN